MRIGLVSVQANPLAVVAGGGIACQHRQVAELARVLRDNGHEVRVYTRRDPVTPPGAGADLGVRVEQGPAAPRSASPDDESPRHVREFAGWLADQWRTGWRPDVVHAHFWLSGVASLAALALLAAEDRRVPVVQTFHSLGGGSRRWYRRGVGARTRVGWERALGRTVDQVIAQYHSEVANLVALGVPRERISLVPSGVDTRVFGPDGDRAPRESSLPRILAVGRPSPHNGYDELLTTLRLVPGAELVIIAGAAAGAAGNATRSSAVRQGAERARVADRVRLLGAVPAAEMPAWYRSADLLACTPWYESFGLPAVEAMACGVPVASYAVGGMAESVVDRVTGRLLPPNDVRGLAQVLRQLLHSDVDRLAFGDASVDRALARYSWDRVGADVQRVYEEALARGAAGAA